jgi:para-aminobenzoate synthetase/4-amino-4-deoxychorismate lyase
LSDRVDLKAARLGAAPFALLDDCTAAPGEFVEFAAGVARFAPAISAPASSAAPDCAPGARGSRLYTGFVREYICHDPADLDRLNALVAADLAAGLHAVVLADYEWGVALAGVPSARHATHDLASHGNTAAPLATTPALADACATAANPTAANPYNDPPPALRWLMFDTLARPSRAEVDAWLAGLEHDAPQPGCAGVLDLKPSVSRAQFEHALGEIDTALRAGEAYQINYTFRLDFATYGEPSALYRRLRARQPVSYGALIALPDERWILSCSPELFVAYDSATGTLSARPMKGTAARSSEPEADRQIAEALLHDVKNRAENLMIVDLLRNDLGRIAQTGSVHVPALFALEAHATVWQMTSSVQAALKPQTSFADVLRALFPCGSITGAPKHRSMALIDALETTPRGIYTGALGWLEAAPAADTGLAASADPATAPHLASPQPAACGDFCLSVAIRTLTLQRPRADAPRVGRMGIGAGIVLDSRSDDEYAECYLKARFLSGADPGLTLFETMRASRASGVPHLDLHLARLARAAQRLGFAHDPQAWRATVLHCVAALASSAAYRLRLTLAHDGAITLSHDVLPGLPKGPVKVMLAQQLGLAPTHAADPLLALKSSRRDFYDRAWQQAQALGGFDAIFTNTRGELTEGGRSNLFVKLEGRWWTPPLACGVLPGIQRAILLQDPQWDAAERVLWPQDQAAAQALVVCNALRGVLPAQLARPGE